MANAMITRAAGILSVRSLQVRKEIIMKKLVCFLAIAALATLSQAHASNVGVSVGVNIGAPVVVAAPPQFVMPPQLGFYVAVGVPYDFYYHGGRYYQPHGNVWYSSRYYNGPWTKVHYKRVPYGLRKYPTHKVHYYRDNYYAKHRNHPGPGYREFRPAKRHGGGNDYRNRGNGHRSNGHGGRK
jgi:hypothetical protein